MSASRYVAWSAVLLLLASSARAARFLQEGHTGGVFGGRFSLNSAFNVQNLNGGDTIALTLSQAGGNKHDPPAFLCSLAAVLSPCGYGPVQVPGLDPMMLIHMVPSVLMQKCLLDTLLVSARAFS